MTTQEELSTTIRDLVQPGKGILAADESHPTIAKRFKAVGVESSEDMRREYRSLIFSASGLGEFISGVILLKRHSASRASIMCPCRSFWPARA